MIHRIASKHKWVFAPLILAAIAAFSFITMFLWNGVMPDIFHLPVITFWQALSLLILSRLFFGGFGQHNSHKASDLRHKVAMMSPEEREKFFKHLRERRENWWYKRPEHPGAPTETEENKPF